MFAAGTAVAICGMVVGGRQVQRTRYRPDPWLAPEWAVVTSGVVCAMAMFVVGWVDPAQLIAPLDPLAWPSLPVVPAMGILVAATPAILAPPVATPPQRHVPDQDRGRTDEQLGRDRLDRVGAA
jgi:energy-coupling factor transport system permease protein